MPRRKLILVSVSILVLIGSVFSLWRSCSRPSPRFRAENWFYDLNTGQLFPGPRGAIPPIDAPSGPLPDGTPAGVRAHVFGCGGCDPKNRTIAWLETYTVQERDQLTPPPITSLKAEDIKPFMPAVQFSPRVKRVDGTAWVSKDSPEGAILIRSALPQCPDGSAPRECWP